MEQLIMNWRNDGTPAEIPTVLDGLRLTAITDVENGIDKWLDVVQYGLSDGKQDETFYNNVMVGHENYDAQYCFLLMDKDIAVATIAIIFYPDKSDGYIHMVACKEQYRGRGIGTYMNELAVYMLKKHGMKTAYLTTDDWRIPAIKSYLRADFKPDLSTDDFKNRWENIFKVINA